MRPVSSLSTNILEHAQALNHLTRNRVGEVTLTAGATSTIVTDPTVTPDSVFLLDPLTANAAAALPTTFIAAADRSLRSFIITHANSAQTDRTFRWLAAGD